MTIENEDYLEAKQRLMEKILSEEAYSKLTQKEKNSYQLSLKVDRDLVNSFDTANQVGFEKGFEKGREEEIKKGIEQGIKQEKLHIAINLLKSNLPIELIAQTTELTLEKIEELKNNFS